MEFEIPHPSPSANRWVYRPWWAYAAIKNRWIKRVWGATIGPWPKHKFGKPVMRARLWIVRFGARELDWDNLHGGMKPIVDALVNLGYLHNDTPSVLIQTPEISQQKCKKVDERTYIRLEEV